MAMIIPTDMFRQVIEEMMPFHKFLGVKLLDASDGYAKMLFPFKPDYVGDPRSQRLHGGYVATAIDSIGGAAAMTQLQSEKDKMATVDMRIDYLNPGKPEDLIAEGRIVRNGNRIISTEMKVYHPSDENKILAIGHGIYNFRKAGDDC